CLQQLADVEDAAQVRVGSRLQSRGRLPRRRERQGEVPAVQAEALLGGVEEEITCKAS
ncbi:hypothetical protein THAOC_19606, partial [Thalassiosira oceanica]